MISRVRGVLVRRDLGAVEIMTSGGVTYEIEIPLSVYERLPAEGADIELRTYQVVREDSNTLYGFIDHSGRLGEYKLTDGTKAVSSYRRPHTLYLLETFKIKAGKIARIEAVFTTVPYKMPYPAAK